MKNKHIKDYIPRDKSDVQSVEELSKIGYPFYRPILGDLFKCIEDINWPIAPSVVPLLIAAGDDVIPHIRLILESKDAIWEYWTLYSVVSKMPIHVIVKLKDDLQRIVDNPSSDEISEEVDKEAKSLLEKLR